MKSLQIKYFLALAKYKSFSETARRLYVAQPAVSKQIASLESELNMKLFVRKPRSVELTEEGKIMFNAFKEIEDIFHKAVEEARQRVENINFRIGFFEGGDVEPVFINALNKVKNSFPQVRFKAEYLPFLEIKNALLKREIDLAITCDEKIKYESSIDYKLVDKKQTYLVVAKENPLAKGDELDREILKKQKFFFVENDNVDTNNFCKFIEEKLGIPSKNFIIVPNIDTLVFNVDSGKGVTAIFLNKKLKSNPNVKLYPLEDFKPLNIYAAWNCREDIFKSRIRQHFIDEIKSKAFKTA